MDTITLILTVWKRIQYLEEQFQALTKQTVPPACIWIIQNETHIDIEPVLEKYKAAFPEVHVFHADFNLKFFGRFSLAAHVQTPYTFILDDDVIPGPKWLEYCMEKCNQYEAVICSTGRIVQEDNFRPEVLPVELLPLYFIGDNLNDDDQNCCEHDTVVDYGCNSYFFKTGWIALFWHIWPHNMRIGDDIHLSASLKLLASIPTIIPRQTNPEESGNLNKYYSRDMLSSWRHDDFIPVREKVFKYLIHEKKWRPLQWTSLSSQQQLVNK